jgi:hypothetical protein
MPKVLKKRFAVYKEFPNLGHALGSGLVGPSSGLQAPLTPGSVGLIWHDNEIRIGRGE